jgi:hypothetical protein
MNRKFSDIICLDNSERGSDSDLSWPMSIKSFDGKMSMRMRMRMRKGIEKLMTDTVDRWVM